tara:strand:- start:44 stop:514 length:471 start_codon:yes stop_codon:yes gene_type:complete
MTLKTNKIFPRDGKLSGAYGGIIQVVHSASTTGGTIDSTSYSDFLTATITPQSASNAILIQITFNANNADNSASTDRLRYQINRTVGGSATTLYTVAEALVGYTGDIHVQGLGNNYVDTPATTSACTYALRFSVNAGECNINNNGRTDIILMELAG